MIVFWCVKHFLVFIKLNLGRAEKINWIFYMNLIEEDGSVLFE